MTHEYADNMNRILEYLTRNDQELENVNLKFDKVDSFQPDSLMVSRISYTIYRYRGYLPLIR